MITKSDLSTCQTNCSHSNGNGAGLDSDIESRVSESAKSEGTANDSSIKIAKQKVTLCNGNGSRLVSPSGYCDKDSSKMEFTATNGHATPPFTTSTSKDSGFSTPVPSTSGSSGAATPSNSDNQEPMETMESTLASIATTPSQDSDLSYSASAKPCTASNIIENEIDDDRNDVFYFESDHSALKGNLDFQNLLKTVTLLEAQRTRAINDLDKLIATEKDALNDPVNFVQKLQQKKETDIPPRLNVPSLPKVQWDKYTNNVDPLNLGKHKHMTRNKKGSKHSNTSKGYAAASCSSDTIPSGAEADLAIDDSDSDVKAIPTVIRGRVKDDGKSETFNKLWTTEEQQKLEELLIKYPAELVEARRWVKIAAELRNRTPGQVQSRVQKYFIKLAKAGLPVPGRIPNMQVYTRKHGSSSNRQRRYNQYTQPSTFMSSFIPPVYMNDMEDENVQNYGGSDFPDPSQFEGADGDSDDDIPAELKASEEYGELIKLRRLRREKMKEEGQARHIGFKCDRCDCDPIVGIRWHCVDCPEDMSTDFCSNCFDSQFQTESHNSSHRLERIAVQHSSSDPSKVDTDYTKFMHRDYNYLDPNYMPAS